MNAKNISKFFEYLLLRIRVRRFTWYFGDSREQGISYAIMQENFLGIDDMVNIFRFVPDDVMLEKMSKVPYDFSTLERYKNNYILVPVLPISIREIADMYPWFKSWLLSNYRHNTLSQELSLEESWLDEKPIAGWYLIRKTHFPDSEFKTLSEQEGLLETCNTIPSAQIILYAIVGYVLTQDKLLFKQTGVRTNTIDANNKNVTISPRFFTNTKKVCETLEVKGMGPDYSQRQTGIATHLKHTQ